jgi:4,5-DOPA dioxygenase extradiol
MAETSERPMMPAAFFGHGSPMNALESNRFTEAWKAFGESVRKPRAILVVSAHWYIGVTAVTAMAKPRTIHDFYGFPRRLFEVEYSAPGDAALAEEVAEIAKPVHVGMDADSWGLDHGTWSVLVHAFPNADIPVVQLSIHARKDFDYHLQLGAKLSPLRERGVLVLGSGNLVHNLRMLSWSEPELGFDWAQRFNEAARELLTTRPAEVAQLASHPDFARAVPTPDHFIPLLYLAGLASVANRPLRPLVEGYAFGSISMDCFALDAHPLQKGDNRRPAAKGPEGRIPAEETNL